MSLDTSLAHKLAAWNERRLYRDLYDIYIFVQQLGVLPDLDVLQSRLNHIESRHKNLKKVKKMNLKNFLEVLKNEVEGFVQTDYEKELNGLVPKEDLIRIDYKLKIAVHKLISKLESKAETNPNS